MLNQREIYSESFLPDDAYCLREQGYRSLPSSFYRNVLEDRSLGLLKRSYEQLPADQYGGGRYRAHSRYFLKGQEAVLDSNSSYFQSKHYNSLHGDIVRQFEPMNDLVLRSSALRRLVEKDRKLAEATRILDFKSNEIVMGLHQIRYRVKDNEVSFSSPIWLHKDDEDIVFIHLLSVSPQLLGGDNLIAKQPKAIDRVIRLRTPLETLVVAKSVFHAVTPLASGDGSEAARDILLVTFSKRNSS